jgi:hypothetical protein
MKRKMVVLGRGTAGAQAMAHFVKNAKSNWELEWHYDPNTPTQAVGEGSTLELPINLYNNLNFSYDELSKINGSLKAGIWKEGWNPNGESFLHSFQPPAVALHFNAIALQNYVFDKIKDKVTLVEHNITSDQIDADYIMDCSGKPSDLSLFDESEYIAVNSVYVTQCYWDFPRFNHTLAIARPYGWVFGIPLNNRCSIGYMYNNNINTLEEVKEDVKYIFEKYNLQPSNDTNSFSFGSYGRKVNYTDRIVYNGNASFFLEPLEATSIGVMSHIQHNAYYMWTKLKHIDTVNADYKRLLNETEVFIMMHYYAGSQFNTKFWDYARERGERCMESVKHDKKFIAFVKESLNMGTYNNHQSIPEYINNSYGGQYTIHWLGSILQNIKGLGVENQLLNMINGEVK